MNDVLQKIKALVRKVFVKLQQFKKFKETKTQVHHFKKFSRSGQKKKKISIAYHFKL